MAHNGLCRVGRGVSPRASQRTVRDSLPSYGYSKVIYKIAHPFSSWQAVHQISSSLRLISITENFITTTDESAPVPSIAILPLVCAILHFTLHLGSGSRVS